MRMFPLAAMICAAALLAGAPAYALDKEEKLARECNRIYVKLCRGIKPGPTMIGECANKKPDLESKIPAKCVTDFQTNVENYNDAMAAGKK
jgi:hypothetical protein